MPIYEYACDACEHRFERLQSFKDDPVKVCPDCGEASCRRLISAPGIVFKGSGWYIKDSKTGGGRLGSSTRSDKAEREDTGGGEKGNSETGSAAKKDGAKKTESTGTSGSSAPSDAGGSKKADA